jgi:L-tartrate/succinate antiporter
VELRSIVPPVPWKGLVPIIVGAGLVLLPAPSGLTPGAWRYFSLFAAVVAGLVVEPIPAPAVGFVGMAIGAASCLVPALPFALLLCDSLGMMGILTPYASGPAPVYFGSGFVSRKECWTLGLVFGVIFLLTLISIGIPWLLLIHP